jgi:hypothetical protein
MKKKATVREGYQTAAFFVNVHQRCLTFTGQWVCEHFAIPWERLRFFNCYSLSRIFRDPPTTLIEHTPSTKVFQKPSLVQFIEKRNINRKRIGPN